MHKICMLHYSSYPDDPRPRREAEALAGHGYIIDTICIPYKNQKKEEKVGNINVHRISIKRKRENKLRYVYEYSLFFLLSLVKITFLHIKKRYSIIHIHNMPDVLVFCALIPKLFGAKVILDLHDPTPELYMTKYDLTERHIIIKFLIFLEKISIRFADMVITPNTKFKELFISRSCPPSKIHIIMNSPDEKIFFKQDIKRDDVEKDKFIIMYHGFIAERNGLGTALDAISIIRDKIPNLLFKVYGNGDFTDTFLKYRQELNLEDIVNYYGGVPNEEIAQVIQTIDLGVIPNKKNPFTDINFPTRIFEYISLDKPVIVPKTRGIIDYFDSDDIFYFNPNNHHDLANVITNIHANQQNVLLVLQRGKEIYNNFRWEQQKTHLGQIVDELLTDTKK